MGKEGVEGRGSRLSISEGLPCVNHNGYLDNNADAIPSGGICKKCIVVQRSFCQRFNIGPNVQFQNVTQWLNGNIRH